MRAQILGMRQGARNATEGINLIQLAEGSLNEVSSMLLRMRELAVQSANSTINDGNRIGISNEFNALNSEIDRVALSTTYNDQSLLTGFGNSVSQDRTETSALDGFSGVTEIGVSGAVPGTYTFRDDDNDDNKITLSVAQIDGTVIEQTIDVGSTLDRSDAGVNLVATGTTFIANFDRLGIQATLVGPGVDSNSDTVKLATPPTADGNLFIGEEVVEISETVNRKKGQKIADRRPSQNHFFEELSVKTHGVIRNFGRATNHDFRPFVENPILVQRF